MQIVETTIFGEEDVNMAQLTVTETPPFNGTLEPIFRISGKRITYYF